MSSETVLRCRDLRKTFRIYRRPVDRAAELLCLGLRRMHRPFDALDGISFDLRRGESVAVLGANGSGKSTMLQILAGTMRPSAGRIEVEGRVAALLELGAGFIGEVTAAENAVLAARLYGMNEAEAVERLPWIASFAELEEHLDIPVKFFSSGMYARLAFAVAVAVKPDVILIDEALSVGDIAFQRKAERYLREELADAAKVVVSHDHESIARHCTRAIVLRRGTVAYDGPVEEGLRQAAGTSVPAQGSRGLTKRMRGALDVVATDIRVSGASSDGSVMPGDPIEVEVTLESRSTRPIHCILGHFWTDPAGHDAFGACTESDRVLPVAVPKGVSVHRMSFRWPRCKAGPYRLNVAAVSIDRDGNRVVQCRVEDAGELVCADPQSWGVSFFVDGTTTTEAIRGRPAA